MICLYLILLFFLPGFGIGEDFLYRFIESHKNRIGSEKVTENKTNPSSSRIALIGIIVEDLEMTDRINEILHEYREYIIGRMGIPYKIRGVAIISVVVDAPGDKISALSGKLGMIKNVSTKVQYTNVM